MTDEIDLDEDFSDLFGDDDGFGDLGMDPSEPNPKDRNPVSKAGKSALEEFASGEGTSRAISKAATKALPPGYKAAFEAQVNLRDDMQSIYDKTVKDLGPSIKSLKKIGRAAIPGAEKILPKKLVDKLKDATEQRAGGPQFDPNEMAIASSMQGIFGAEAEARSDQAAKDDANREVDREIGKKQFASSQGTQNQIADGISRLVGYQDNILSKYQRKSLELQHRHFFAARDTLAHQKASTQDILSELKSIRHNTGLPEQVKIQTNEAMAQNLRETLLGKVNQTAAQKMGGMGKRLKKNLTMKARDFTESMNSNLEQFGDMAEMMGGDDDGPDIDMTEVVGSQVGGAVRDKLVMKAMQMASKKAMDTEGGSALERKLLFGTRNMSKLINEKLLDDNNQGFGFDLARDLVGTTRGNSETVTHNLEEKATQSVQWDLLSRRTVTEIIPGYLSRILQQLTNIATGQDNERVIYSVAREEFVTQDVARKDLQSRVSKKLNTSLATEVNSLINSIDPGRVLSAKARKDFAMQLAKDAEAGKPFNPVRYADPSNIDSAEAGLIAEVVAGYFRVDANGVAGDETGKLSRLAGRFDKLIGIEGMGTDAESATRFEAADRSFDNIGKGVVNLDDILNTANATGDKELLREIGLIGKKDGLLKDTVNFDTKWDMIRQQLDGDVSGATTTRDLPKGFVEIAPGVYKQGPDAPAGMGTMGGPRPSDSGGSGGMTFDMNEAMSTMSSSIETALKGANISIGKDLEDILSKHAADNSMHLSKILAALQAGIDVRGVINGGMSDEAAKVMDQFNKLATGAADAAGGAKSGVKDLLMKGAEGAGSMLGTVYSAYGDMFGAGFSGLKNLGNMAKDFIREKFIKGKEKSRDIYVKGREGTIALRASLLDAGEYYYKDAQGKLQQVKSFDEIKGDVYDKGGKLILDGEDWIKGLVDQHGEDAKSLFSKVKGWGGDLLSKQLDLMGAALTLPGKAKAFAIRMAFKPFDVYVKGEDTPRLRAAIFENGGYFSDTTGKVLVHPGQIDGPVKDAAGNILINSEDVQKGLVDVNGKDIEAKSLGGLVMSKVGGALGMAKNIGMAAFDLSKSAFGTAKELAVGLFGRVFGDGEGGFALFSSQSRSADLLEQIYNHMRIAFPINAADVKLRDSVKQPSDEVQDATVDRMEQIATRQVELMEEAQEAKEGPRAGSYEAQRAEDEATEKMSLKDKMKGKFGAFTENMKGKMAGLGGLLGFLKKKDKKDSEEDDDDDEGGFFQDMAQDYLGDKAGDLIGKAGKGIKNIAKKAPGASKAAGFLAKMGIGTAATTAAGSLVTGGGAAATTAAATTGAAATGGGLLATAGAIGGGVLTFLTSPVVLAGAAVAGTAAATYYGYKYFSRRADLEPLEKLRYLQYGIDVNNKDMVIGIRYLEDELDGEFFFKDKKTGIIDLDMKWEEIWDDYADNFGAEKDNKKHEQDAYAWFYGRFVPVFVRHKAAAQIFDESDVLDVDDELDDEDKGRYVQVTHFGAKDPKQPYAVMKSPWPDMPLVDNIEAIAALAAMIKKASKEGKSVDLDNIDAKEFKKQLEDAKDKGIPKTPAPKPLQNKGQRYGPDLMGQQEKEARAMVEHQNGSTMSGVSENARRRMSPAMKAEIDGVRKAGDTQELAVPAMGRISSPFGNRTHPIKGKKKMHKGIDIAAPAGSPVYACDDGIVDKVYASSSYGNVIYLNHPDGRHSRYAHLQSWTPWIFKGAAVKKGDHIGYVGSTGNSTGPHLHFEYRENDGAYNNASVLNPMPYFEKIAKTNIVPDDGADPDEADDDYATSPSMLAGTNVTAKTPVKQDVAKAFTPPSAASKQTTVAAARAQASNPSPTVNVTGPDMSEVTLVTRDAANNAETQRQKQIEQSEAQTAMLGIIAEHIGKEKGVDPAETKRMIAAKTKQKQKAKQVDLVIT